MRAVEEKASSMGSLELGTKMASRHRKHVGTGESLVAIGYSGIAPRDKSSISMTKEKPRFSISSIGLTNRRILLLFPAGYDHNVVASDYFSEGIRGTSARKWLNSA